MKILKNHTFLKTFIVRDFFLKIMYLKASSRILEKLVQLKKCSHIYKTMSMYFEIKYSKNSIILFE